MKGQEQENLLSKQNGHDPSQPSLKLKVIIAHGGIQVVPPNPPAEFRGKPQCGPRGNAPITSRNPSIGRGEIVHQRIMEGNQ